MPARSPISASRPDLDPLHVREPILAVRDLDGVARYYEDTIGLVRLDGDAMSVRLGAGEEVLLHLQRHADADLEPRGFAGLFHTAFLLPTRGDLGRWLRRAIAAKVRFDGASNHNVSEALYLSDPEGNGIEIYADRPRETWSWTGGEVTMGTVRLDVEDLVAAGGPVAPEQAQMPDGSIVGHIHLKVGGIPEAEAFYRDVIGLEVTMRRQGATFYAAGGYHHHVATNIWASRNAPRRSGDVTGLVSFELCARGAGSFDAAAERCLAAGGRRVGDAIEIADPWANRIIVRRV